MRLGMIVRADNTGLGVQSWEAYRHLSPVNTMVIDVSQFRDDGVHAGKVAHLDRFPGAIVSEGWIPHRDAVLQLLQGIDVLLSFETFYSPTIVDTARSLGIKTVLAPNFEFFDEKQRPDMLVPPTRWRLDDIQAARCSRELMVLPNPIAEDRLTLRDDFPETASTFLHIVGKPAIHDRNGTMIFLDALRQMTVPARAIIRCQDPTYVGRLYLGQMPSCVELDIRTDNLLNYWDAYDVGDCLVMPRRYGGLCLPMQEAMGRGMPAIMPAIEPNRDFLPPQLLVEASPDGAFQAKQRVEKFATNPTLLAAAMTKFAVDCEEYGRAKQHAMWRGHHQFSWGRLQKHWLRALSA